MRRSRVRRRGPNVQLVGPTSAHRADYLDAARSSRTHLLPWVEAPEDSTGFSRLLERDRRPDHVVSLIIDNASGGLVGASNLANIVEGNLRAAQIGYYAFASYAGRGLLTEAVLLTVRHAFEDLRLRRVEANIQPDNERSIALIRRCGFRLEGFSPRYLYICGDWRDHERWAATADTWHDPG